jgi:hypothetical protein
MLNTYCVDTQSSPPHSVAAAESGFTASDLVALNELHTVAAARRQWSRAQLVSQEFAQYLAVWGADAGTDGPPAIVVARFKRTGTYALMIGSMIVASGAALGAVLPALLYGVKEGEAACA